jgi:hypothetical protein
MRDDLAKEKLPAAVKRYARLKGPAGTSPKKFNLFNKLSAQLANVPAVGFKNKDDSRSTAGSKLREDAANVVDQLIRE